MASQARKQRQLACDACRSRRTRRDGRKPICNTCESRGLDCRYPEAPKRAAPDIESEFARLRSQLDRIEQTVTTRSQARRESVDLRDHGTSPWSASIATTTPGVPVPDFPFMQVKNSVFTRLAGLGENFGNHVLRLERAQPLAATPTTSLFVLQHPKIMASLQSFSEVIHPWYPILESGFSTCISSCLANSFARGTDSFLVLMVLASGAIAEANSREALLHRPDSMYLNAALEMMHLIVLEQSLRSVQCLAAASIHFYLLLKPVQAHELAVMAIKKSRDLLLSDALQDDRSTLEHLIRVYRAVLLVDGELVVPLRFSDNNAWEHEEEVPLPTGTDIWSFENNAHAPGSSDIERLHSAQSDQLVTYLLAEIAMRRMLRRNTTSVSYLVDGTIQYAPLIARELEAQLEQWYSFLPESFRFSPDFKDTDCPISPQVEFLRTQYWACMVSFSWPAIIQAMESQYVSDNTLKECSNYFHSFRQFIRSATAALETCLPNKWTIYASIFAISIGAYLGASTKLLTPLISEDTYAALRLASDVFGDECRYSPSLLVMQQRIQETFSSLSQAI